jgi:hypothetical protein
MTQPTCWMCGAEANSSEHRLKKADIVRAYGRGPYSGDHRPMHVRTGKLTEIQGPNSRTIKYAAILCHTCNTTSSQPYDVAYDRLIEWVFQNESFVLRRRFIDFADVFGPDFPLHQRNLYKYFAKSFGCRLIEAGQVVPDDVRNLFDKEQFQTALRITFSVNEDILAMPASDRQGFIGKSDLVAMVQRNDHTQIDGISFNEHVSWFTTHYWYALSPDGNLGAVWVADSQHIYLGSHEPLSPELRAEMIEKLTARGAESAT